MTLSGAAIYGSARNTILMEGDQPKFAIFVVGPTAAGKTATAIALAERLQCEILSFDSRQFYRELKIGAAPPSEEELRRVPHHFVGHLSVNESLSAGQYEKRALAKMETLHRQNPYCILVGGSGLYMRALTEGFDDIPPVDVATREAVRELYQKDGLEALQDELQRADPEYHREADLQNPQRLMRALEVTHSSGRPYSAFRQMSQATRPWRAIKIGINLPREELYARINARTLQMMEAGLEQEARDLYPLRNHNALQTVGYRELFQYFEGKWSREEAIAEIQKNTRRYAKRQLTWFRRDPEIRWFSPRDIAGISSYLKEKV